MNLNAIKKFKIVRFTGVKKIYNFFPLFSTFNYWLETFQTSVCKFVKSRFEKNVLEKISRWVLERRATHCKLATIESIEICIYNCGNIFSTTLRTIYGIKMFNRLFLIPPINVTNVLNFCTDKASFV